MHPRPDAERGFLSRAHATERVAAWREAFLFGLIAAASFVPFDLLYAEHRIATLALRFALIAAVAGSWLLLGRASTRWAGAVVVTGATAAAVLTPLTVVAASGMEAPRFGFVLAVPFVVLTLLPEVPAVALFGSVVAAAAGGLALLAGGRRWPYVAEWVTLAMAVTAVTAVGARRIGAVERRARDAGRKKRVAVARLEESERRRAASERLSLVGRLASDIGHEINNPLSAVKGNLACALEELERSDGAPAAREALAEALAAAERIAWITSDMRALSAEPPGPLAACSVDDAIRRALGRSAARLEGAKVELVLEPGLPRVYSEPRLLADAVGRLVAHAAARRGAGGEASVRVRARRVDGLIEIAVEDHGPPLPDHLLQTLFEPFAAHGVLPGAGGGLALPFTRELVERAGGRVDASRHAGGNRFSLTLAASDT